MYEYLTQYFIDKNIKFSEGIFKDGDTNIESLIFYCTLEECKKLSKRFTLDICEIRENNDIIRFVYTNDDESIYNFKKEVFDKYVTIYSKSLLILLNL